MFAIRNKCHATSSNSNGLQPNSDVLHERKRPSVLLRVCHRRIRVATQYWLRNARIQNGNGLLVGRVIVVSLSCFVVSLSFCLQISLLVEDRAGKYITFWVMVCYCPHAAMDRLGLTYFKQHELKWFSDLKDGPFVYSK